MFFLFKQKTAYEMRISDWSSDVCSSDLASNGIAWKTYLGALFGADVPAYAAAARATDYRGLPPTCTFVGDLEPFRDETLRYVENLKAAGLPVAFELFRGALDGCEVVAPKTTMSQRATAFWSTRNEARRVGNRGASTGKS